MKTQNIYITQHCKVYTYIKSTDKSIKNKLEATIQYTKR